MIMKWVTQGEPQGGEREHLWRDPVWTRWPMVVFRCMGQLNQLHQDVWDRLAMQARSGTSVLQVTR